MSKCNYCNGLSIVVGESITRERLKIETPKQIKQLELENKTLKQQILHLRESHKLSIRALQSTHKKELSKVKIHYDNKIKDLENPVIENLDLYNEDLVPSNLEEYKEPVLTVKERILSIF